MLKLARLLRMFVAHNIGNFNDESPYKALNKLEESLENAAFLMNPALIELTTAVDLKRDQRRVIQGAFRRLDFHHG